MGDGRRKEMGVDGRSLSTQGLGEPCGGGISSASERRECATLKRSTLIHLLSFLPFVRVSVGVGPRKTWLTGWLIEGHMTDRDEAGLFVSRKDQSST